MKTTTCVRVVLPTDELVRIECSATMTVADLKRTLKERCRLDKTHIVKKIGNKYCDDNNDPAIETTTDCQPNEFLSGSTQGTLTLVRTESELSVQALVIHEVEELDILEFAAEHLRSFESSRILRSRKISPIPPSLPHVATDTVRPASATLNQSCQMNDKASMHLSCSESSGLQAPAASPYDLEVRTKKHIQLSKVAQVAFQRRARRHFTTRIKHMRLLVAEFKKTRNHAKERTSTECILLFQLIECLELVQENVRRLVFLLRDSVLGRHPASMCELVSIANAMVKTLSQTEVDTDTISSSFPQDNNESLVRKLTRKINGKDGAITVVLQGWVVSAEWGTFWRSQRREYACLCDNYMLYFFTSQAQCDDFIFELGRKRDGYVLESSKRRLKENRPLSQVDLTETDWTIRKSFRDASHETLHRHAIAFFDPNGRMRLVLDVSTSAEATMWAREVAAQISQCQLFARVRELHEETVNKGLGDCANIANPFMTWTKILAQSSAPMNHQNSLRLSLRSLYSQIDRRNATARAERSNSWTLGQALKDLQRDCAQVNGLVLAGNSLEENILVLTLEILKCTKAGQKSKFRAKDSKESMPLNAAEMIALRFARQVIIYSSRTHKGGDIFDMLHLLFDSKSFCICPDTGTIEPIKIEIVQEVDTLCAHITMQMIYRVISREFIGPVSEEADTSVSIFDRYRGNAERQQTAEFKVVGTHSQRVSCNCIKANDIEGSVQLQVAKGGHC